VIASTWSELLNLLLLFVAMLVLTGYLQHGRTDDEGPSPGAVARVEHQSVVAERGSRISHQDRDSKQGAEPRVTQQLPAI
jgi:hypothetical protein